MTKILMCIMTNISGMCGIKKKLAFFGMINISGMCGVTNFFFIQ